jgi:hypothetical protein
VGYLVGSCVQWFIGTLPDRPIGLYRLKHDVALQRGLAYLSRCNSGWFCHRAPAAGAVLLHRPCAWAARPRAAARLAGPHAARPRAPLPARAAPCAWARCRQPPPAPAAAPRARPHRLHSPGAEPPAAVRPLLPPPVSLRSPSAPRAPASRRPGVRPHRPSRRPAPPAPGRQPAPVPAWGRRSCAAAWSRAKGGNRGRSSRERRRPKAEEKEAPGEDKRERERKNREEREMGFPKDLCVNLENCRDLFVKHKFPVTLKPERRNAQNESWRVFHTLQHCFRAQLQKLKIYIFTSESLNKSWI